MDYIQSDLEKLEDIYKSGFISEYEFNRRKKELGFDDDSSHNGVPVLNNTFDYNSNNNNNDYSSNNYNNTYNNDDNYSTYTVPTISYDFNSNNDYNQVIPVLNNDYNSDIPTLNNDYNTVTPISTYDYNSNNNNDYNTTATPVSTFDYNSNNNTDNQFDLFNDNHNTVTPVSTIDYNSNNKSNNQFDLFNDDYVAPPPPIKKDNGFSLFDSGSDTEEPEPIPVVIQEKVIPKVSRVIANKNIDASKQNLPKEYPLKVRDNCTIYKDLEEDTIILYMRSRECSYQSNPINIKGKTVSAVHATIANHFGFNCSTFRVFKLTPNFNTEEIIKKNEYSYYHTEGFENLDYVPKDSKWESGHYLVKRLTVPIHRSSWTSFVDESAVTSNFNPLLAFHGTETKPYNMEMTASPYQYEKERFYLPECKKDGLWLVLDFFMYTSCVQFNQDGMNRGNIYTDLWKDHTTISKKRENILNSIKCSKCIFCKKDIDQSSLVCYSHFDEKLLSKYERCKEYLFKDLSNQHDPIVENKINQQPQPVPETKVELSIAKEKFCYAKPDEIMAFLNKRKF
ncbi:hypothetical protein CYY_001997 [Polysphondylium violaceum]|uniref:SHOCT domain-containing protein n=1 Tax=Polysphondylium violaceum TaxID=133409 RepID=A0A8J4Q0S9_9MYCE|nr:hypothetical protein CYY_001997 [Polysphondylium violaceum]